MSNVFFDISINSLPPQRITFKLYDTTVPKTCRNFRELATGAHGFGYEGSEFHRIKPGFMVQGGRCVNNDVEERKSIYGGRFADENFEINHTKPGLLSMANSGKDTNGTGFFITTAVTDWLDGKHVVFGEVIEGYEVVKAIEALGLDSGKPTGSAVIVRCGVVEE
ncbi:cyclophilin 1 [Panaeolus papilionaceus]|nr:cyclophilin 1 [Panaeolus papilionaceus]